MPPKIPLILGCAMAAHGLSAQVTIDYAVEHQTLQGFGASTAWYADEFEEFEPEVRAQIIKELFDPAEGLGLDILRIRIDPSRSIEGSADYDWQDDKMLRQGAIIQRIEAAYDPVIMCVPWTPPDWMKDTGKHSDGGHLLSEHYATYADYQVGYVEGMKREFGIDIDILSVQNEPGPKTWESCEWTNEELVTYMRDHLIPEMEARIPGVKLMADENTDWKDDRLNVLLADPTIGAAIDIAGAHCYWNTHLTGKTFETALSMDKPIWQTEFYLAKTPFATELTHALQSTQVVHNFLQDVGVNVYNYWWALSPYGKPEQGLLNGAFEAAEFQPPYDEFRVTKVARMFAHYSRFLEPGYQRIDISDSEPDLGVQVSAWKDPFDSQIVIVAINGAGVEKEVSIDINGFDLTELSGVRSGGEEDLAAIDPTTVNEDGTTTLVLAPASVTTFYTAAPNTFSQWRHEQGFQGGPLHDADEDGLSNLLEFATGLNPLSADPMTASLQRDPENAKAFTFTRATNAAGAELTFAWSTDLETWSTDEVTLVPVEGADTAEGVELLKATVDATTDDRVFARVTVSQPIY